jgi:GABA permease
MPWTTNVLVVANVTASSSELADALVARHHRGATAFTLVVPATPLAGGRQAAAERLERALDGLAAVGLEVEGHVADGDPIVAVTDEWDPRRYDEVIISTLPMRFSKWLHAGLPERVERMTGARVTHVVAEPERPEPETVTAPVHEKHGVITPLYGVMRSS